MKSVFYGLLVYMEIIMQYIVSVSHYVEYEKEFNLHGISFPMTLNDISKFEKVNKGTFNNYVTLRTTYPSVTRRCPHGLNTHDYGYQVGTKGQEGFVYPLKVSKEVNDRHVDLPLIADDDTNHYCFIKDFGKLVGSQYSSHTNKTYFCRVCLHGFSTHSTSRGQDQKHRSTDEEMKKKLKVHEENCFAFAAQRTKFPDDPAVKFGNVQKQVEAPFTVYADVESMGVDIYIYI